MHFLITQCTAYQDQSSPDIHILNHWQLKCFSPDRVLQFTIDTEKVYFIGDTKLIDHSVITKLFQQGRNTYDIINSLLTNVKGFFYCIFTQDGQKEIIVFSSLFGILPLYYSTSNNDIGISSSGERIRQQMQFTGIDHSYILQKLLFNYCLFDDTLCPEIKLCPTNSFLKLSAEGCSHHEVFDYTSFIPSEVKPWRKSLDSVADAFIENTKCYFPDESFALSFTGGFDGRTILSVAQQNCSHENINCFSFGSPGSSDVVLPANQAKKIGVPFKPVNLNQAYSHDLFLENALSMVQESEGNATLSRAHYRYAAKQISESSQYMISGNFGSEILRIMHTVGAMISPNLKAIFEMHDNAWISQIRNSKALNLLDKELFLPVVDKLIDRIITYKKQVPGGLSLNQQFYYFIFTELFRKYFGPEIVMQQNYFLHRAPFLDYDFIRTITQTELCGMNGDFYEKNPIKRFTGQMLYASIIKKTMPALLPLKTGKGYAPADLLSPIGKLRIASSFLRKKFGVQNEEDDPYAVLAGITHNYHRLSSVCSDSIGLYSPNSNIFALTQDWQTHRHLYLNIWSLNYFLNNVYAQ